MLIKYLVFNNLLWVNMRKLPLTTRKLPFNYEETTANYEETIVQLRAKYR